MGGGGGGGSHDIIQTPKGRLPQIQAQPVAAPMVIENNHPKMTAAPAINMPKEIQVANNLPNLGDPRTSVVGAPSNGIGSGGGMGIGSGGGIGSGKSNGFGSGSGGGYGGGLYHVGGAVSAPQLVSAPDPEFTDEARRVNYGGVCVVSLIVDTQGNTQRIQVVKHLGMGLDEKASGGSKALSLQAGHSGGKSRPGRNGRRGHLPHLLVLFAAHLLQTCKRWAFFVFVAIFLPNLNGESMRTQYTVPCNVQPRWKNCDCYRSRNRDRPGDRDPSRGCRRDRGRDRSEPAWSAASGGRSAECGIRR